MKSLSLEQDKGSSSLTIVWWLLGLASTVAMSGGSLWLTSIDSKTQRIENKTQEQAEKVSRIEAEQKSRWEETQRRLSQIEQKQDRVEAKIDRLLEGGRADRKVVYDN